MHKSGDRKPKPRFKFDPEQPAAPALAQLLLFLLDAMERNEPGIRAAADTAYLHNFRIACRRSRTLVTQVRQVLPRDELRRFKAAFAWLNRVTGPCRDLDVFLRDLDVLADRAGVTSPADLDVLRDILRAERRTARARLLRALRSRRYQRFKADWRELLDRAAAGGVEARRAGVPVKQVADASIWRIYRRIVKSGKAAGVGSDTDIDPIDAAALHEFRKTGKKLRYLLQAFNSLYSEHEVKDTVKTLKKLQDNLGGVVDANVQMQSLQHLAAQLDPKSSGSTLRALHRLMSCCEEQHKFQLAGFGKQYKRFTAKPQRKRFKRLFKKGPGTKDSGLSA